MIAGEERIRAAFAAAKDEGRAALMPYMMAGFPDRESGLAVAAAYVDAGADLIELGVPFSDPLADGPTIHAADTQALAEGATLRTALEICEAVADQVPVVLMVYVNMVLAHGGGAEFAQAGAGRRRRRGDRPRPAAGRGRGHPRGVRRGRAGDGAAGRADHLAGAPRRDLRRRARLHLPRLHRRDHRRARRAARPSWPSWSPHQGRRGGDAGRGRLRDRHRRPRPPRSARSPTG